ncbi:TonB-dependent receptor PqqU [Serratia sp. M24T3]|uniref:TonB-dependent receptor PqqU n=1 Tax=Serratia sp. M24T3 TaxID=932213 RepID=UPI00025B9111|nr:TonB-dependent receptor PqqU [Serratia sp. M24T3]EIC84553.1 TonB-dependent receptor [Serratia sp. M24T3]
MNNKTSFSTLVLLSIFTPLTASYAQTTAMAENAVAKENDSTTKDKKAAAKDSSVKSDSSQSNTLLIVAQQQQGGLSELDTPAAVSVVDGDDIRNSRPQVNLSESLLGVPGLQVQNRQNYSQDLQLSVRGFGANSTYGVSGVRIYVDGIPATMPDGQGQTSNIDLASVDKIEVLRGPFSALYGNASGGVVNVETKSGSQPTTLTAGTYFGSYGSFRNSVTASGATGDGTHAGDVNYTISASRFTTRGFRDDSAARKNLGNGKLGVRIDDKSTLTLMFNSVAVDANDPGGLTQSEWKANPTQSPRADQYNTRKSIDQTQVGLRYQREITDNDELTIMTYKGVRHTTQYQSIPKAVQANPAYPGGVIVLERQYQGIDTRWKHEDQWGSVPFTIIGGLDYETITERRHGYENFVVDNGVTDYGVKGDERRNERNKMWNLDPYLQTTWHLTDRWTLNAGLRYSTVSFDSKDYYITAGNGDDSGSKRYHKALPMASLSYALTPAWNVYVSAGRGFETPTINQLSYRPDGTSGLNINLKPSTSNTVEIGSKTRIGYGLLTAALFQTDTQNDLAVATSGSGRSSYTNVGNTRRRGLELSFDQQFASDWRVHMAWTLLDATYRDDVTTAVSSIPAGNKMPGIARNSAYASLAWAPEEGFHAGAEIRYMSDIQANDANTAQAPAYTITSLNAGYRLDWRNNWSLDLFTRVDNLFDRHYVGSVIVNETNGRYYEPAPGRNWGGGATLTYTFE